MSIMPLQQAVQSTRAVLANVTADQLGASTPCASWNVSALINHVVGAQHFFTAAVKGEPPSGDSVDFASGDYLAAFDQASAATLEALGADGIMEQIVHLPFGDMPGAAVAGLAATDTFTHGWDLAKATGQSTDLAPELAAGLLAGARMSISEGFRGPEGAAFGSTKEAPAGASNADQLAAFLGRTV